MLFEVDPIYLHYMTDRQERFDLKYQNSKYCGNKDAYILDALEAKTYKKLISKWTIPLKAAPTGTFHL